MKSLYAIPIDELLVELPFSWLPDETLFSLASRYHRIAGHAQAGETGLRLFGHRTRGSAHDLPSRIGELVRRTDTKLGTVESIVRQRTLLPFYLPLRSAAQAAEAIGAMEGDGIGALKFKLGLLTSRFRANHPLKACHACMASDRARWSVAYWHLTHQIPGVWLCPEHGEPLKESLVKSNGVERFLWHLPAEELLIAPWKKSDQPENLDQCVVSRLHRLANGAQALFSLQPGVHLDHAQLIETYRRRLSDMGLITAGGRLRSRVLASSYFQDVAAMAGVYELSSLPATAEQAGVQVGRILYGPRGGTHPLRHLLIITWLFENWNEFWQAYSSIESSITPAVSCATRLPTHRAIDASIKEHVLELLRANDQTMSSIANQFGLDPSTVMAWAASIGMISPRRPKKLKDSIRGALAAALCDGMDKEAAANEFNVSITTITRLLRTEVGLRAKWASARDARARLNAQTAWRNAIQCNPNLTIKFLRMIEPAAYAWLYRNDRGWLKAQSSAIVAHQERGNHASVRWDERDAELSVLVAQACLEIANSHSGKRISLWQIYQRVPELKAKISQLHRMPLTLRAWESCRLLKSRQCAKDLTTAA